MPKRSRESDSEEEEDQDFNPTTTKDESEEDYESADEKTTLKKKAKKEAGDEVERNENGEEYFVLSGKRRITIRSFQGKKCVDLREYYQTKDGEHKPTSKGLLLPLDQFKRLVELLPQVESALERLLNCMTLQQSPDRPLFLFVETNLGRCLSMLLKRYEGKAIWTIRHTSLSGRGMIKTLTKLFSFSRTATWQPAPAEQWPMILDKAGIFFYSPDHLIRIWGRLDGHEKKNKALYETNMSKDDVEVVKVKTDLSSLHESVQSTETQSIHEEEDDLIAREKALVRKLDRRIMPILTLLYICQRLDLSNIGNAKVAGLQKDLNLDDGQFSWVISIYTLGVMAMQIPSNMMMERSRPSIFLSAIVSVWSVVSIMTCFVKDFKTLVVARFFLGIAESPYFPASVFLLTTFYKPREIAVRNAVFYCGNWLSGALGGAFAGAIISGMEGVGGMRGWRWLFVLEGIITLIIGIASYWILPDYPSNTKWLTEQERDLAIRRLGHAAPKEKFSWDGFKAALLDYKVWVFIIIFMAIQTGGQMNYFMPTFIQNVGYEGAMVQYMTIPVYVFAAVLSLVVAVLSDRFQVRSVFIAFCMCVALVGYVIQVTSENHAVLFFSLFLCGGGVWSSLGVSLAWLGDCVPGPRQKKAVAFALLNCISQLANFYAPQLYDDPPRYLKANIVILTYMGVGVVLCFGLRLLLNRANHKLDDKYGKPLVSKNTVIPGGRAADIEIAPETGVSKHFRYLL